MEETTVEALRRLGGIEVKMETVHVKRDGRFSENMAAVFSIFHNHGVSIKEVVSGQRTLEALFLKLTNVRLRDEN
jgi:hypothetical protein